MDPETENYLEEIKGKIDVAYRIAEKARLRGMDPSQDVEALPAGDLASRVEGLVGPEGIALKIKELGRDNLPQIIGGILGDITTIPKNEQEQRIDQALRTALAIITEGVVAAPIEGISKASIKSNPDGSEYLSVYFAGPIRSAGGTAQGLVVLIADHLRRRVGLQEYRPTKDDLERYVEEIKIYNDRVSRLQYLPSDDDIREIVNNLPVCVDGEPTEKREVSIHRDLQSVETNRIRGGMCLVIAEGIAQKARKLMKYSSELGVDWDWLSKVGKYKEKTDVKQTAGFMSETVGGRPIFAEPSAKGAFRLRYGKGRSSGIAAKSIHPGTMILLDSFVATGTQMKIERPGKGCIVTECDSIEGPIVRLKDGSVLRIETREQAEFIKDEVDEILFLGDILITYGDFLQTNTTLLPAGYCEEWWKQDLMEKGAGSTPGTPDAKTAIEMSEKYKVPLHPHYTYRWDDVSLDDLKVLAGWLSNAEVKEKLVVENDNPEGKRVLEFLGVPHRVENNLVIIDEYLPLLYPMASNLKNLNEEVERFKNGGGISVIDFLNSISTIGLRAKSGTYIGARMGRPEKARERKMQPPVHSLFPLGEAGGSERSINRAAERNSISVEVSRYECPKCGNATILPLCPNCKERTKLRRVCTSCNLVSDSDTCPRCRSHTQFYGLQDLDLGMLWKNTIEGLRVSTEVKGVKGMISHYKIPEPLDKGILRAKNDVFVFKDGTIRFDATDAPLTHFRPREVNVSVERLRELGYTKDHTGDELVDEEQILELKVQDVIIPTKGADYLLRVARFMDELLEKFYRLDAFYNAKFKEDLLGHLIVGLAPHTSAGITGRIVGFTNASVCYAHPFWHAAKRRNADGDEDSVMLILDTLINFSRRYLPEKRGGKMDAPLVVTTVLDPNEIDDEAHKIEIVDKYPLEFYEKTWQNVNPSDVKIPTVDSILDKNPYSGIKFTHNTSDITGSVLESRYVTLGTMKEKVDSQLSVAERIRAVDEAKVAELVINSHFLRDTYGNLRAFSRQKFRCVKCNRSYRRIPLVGKCTKCGGKLLLTVSEGSVRKYLGISMGLIEKYGTSSYLKQRLQLLEREIDSVFTNELSKQVSLSDFM
jgi:DNA polymerase II large subunit